MKRKTRFGESGPDEPLTHVATPLSLPAGIVILDDISAVQQLHLLSRRAAVISWQRTVRMNSRIGYRQLVCCVLEHSPQL
jgi:hypothetical protein